MRLLGCVLQNSFEIEIWLLTNKLHVHVYNSIFNYYMMIFVKHTIIIICCFRYWWQRLRTRCCIMYKWCVVWRQCLNTILWFTCLYSNMIGIVTDEKKPCILIHITWELSMIHSIILMEIVDFCVFIYIIEPFYKYPKWADNTSSHIIVLLNVHTIVNIVSVYGGWSWCTRGCNEYKVGVICSQSWNRACPL